MSVFEGSWQSVLPAATDNGPKTGMIRISADGTSNAFTFPVVFTGYQVNLNEKVQILEAFKEAIHVYAFGKSVGQAAIQGVMLAGGSNPLHSQFKDKLIKVYEDKLRAFKLAQSGKLAIISGPGANVVRGVVTNLSYSITGEQSNVISFSLNLAIVSSALGVA